MAVASSTGSRLRLGAAAALALSLALFALLARWLQEGEPTCQGQPLLAWVQQLRRPGDQPRAEAAIRAMGPRRVVPFLLKEVRRDSRREAAATVRNRLPVAVQEFLPGSDNDLILNKIPAALSVLGPAALPDLISATHDKDPLVQRTAIWSISLMGPTAKTALPRLIQLLGPTNALRDLAALAIGQMGPTRTQAIPALIAALPVTARTLGEMGPDAAAAVPALRTLLDSSQERIRLQAATALWRITPDTNLVERVSRELGKRQGYATYKGFLNLLAAMGPAAKPAIPEIFASMSRWGADLSRTVRPVLLKIDPESARLLDASPEPGR